MDANGLATTVWFNPWMYQNGSRSAGLAYEIIKPDHRPAAARGPGTLLAAAEPVPVDPSVVRPAGTACWLQQLVPLILLWAATITVTLIALLIAESDPGLPGWRSASLSSGLSGAGTAVLLMGGLANVWTFLTGEQWTAGVADTQARFQRGQQHFP